MINNNFPRRQFLKASTSAMALGGLAISNPFASISATPNSRWVDRMPINPAIDNLRVVYSRDGEMMKNDPQSWTDLESQNSAVNVEKVHSNLDQMAIALAETATSGQAWEKIFQKPLEKSWEEVQVAIKLNTVQYNWPRLAVIEKLCLALGSLGVPMENITLFDAARMAKFNFIKDYADDYALGQLPEGVQVDEYFFIEEDLSTPTIVMPNDEEVICYPSLVSGEVDILINLAVNKGHGANYGGFTLTMKNHIGSIRCRHYDTLKENIAYFSNMVKSSALLGTSGAPVQQLCIIDSLYATSMGAADSPDAAPYSLVMGTFSPIVDYLTVNQLRGDSTWMQTNVREVEESMLDSFLTNFGYDQNDDEIKDLELINALDYIPVSLRPRQRPGRFSSLNNPSSFRFQYERSETVFDIKSFMDGGQFKIYDLKGNMVRAFNLRPGQKVMHWDGKSSSGKKVPSGTYAGELQLPHKIIRKRILLGMQN